MRRSPESLRQAPPSAAFASGVLSGWRRQSVAFAVANIVFSFYQVVLQHGYRAGWCSDPRSLIGVAMPVVSTLLLVVLLHRNSFRGALTNGVRVGVYLSASIALFGRPMLSAVTLAAGVGTNGPPTPDLWSLGWRATSCVLSVWVLLIVRAWRSEVCGNPGVDGLSRAGLSRLGMLGWLAAGAAYVAGNMVAALTRNQLVEFVGAGFNKHTHAEGGPLVGWVCESLSMALTGLQEEPVFVGVAVVLWPLARVRRLVGVAALTSIVRAVPHLYYAAGAGSHTLAVSAIVIVWAGIWSTCALLSAYYARTLVPIIVAHGLWDLRETGMGAWDVPAWLLVSEAVAVWVLFFAGLFPLLNVLVDTRCGLRRDDSLAVELDSEVRDSVE